MGVGNYCYVAVCSAALGASAPTDRGEGRGISWWPPAYSLLAFGLYVYLSVSNFTNTTYWIFLESHMEVIILFWKFSGFGSRIFSTFCQCGTGSMKRISLTTREVVYEFLRNFSQGFDVSRATNCLILVLLRIRIRIQEF